MNDLEAFLTKFCMLTQQCKPGSDCNISNCSGNEFISLEYCKDLAGLQAGGWDALAMGQHVMNQLDVCNPNTAILVQPSRVHAHCVDRVKLSPLVQTIRKPNKEDQIEGMKRNHFFCYYYCFPKSIENLCSAAVGRNWGTSRSANMHKRSGL